MPRHKHSRARRQQPKRKRSKRKHWIKKALANHKTGSLHRMLKVPLGRKLPPLLLRKAIVHPEQLRSAHWAAMLLKKRAQLAETLAKLRPRKHQA